MDKLILELHEELIYKEQRINELKEVIDLQRTQMVAYQERFRVLQDRINNAIELLDKFIPKDDDTILFTNNSRRKLRKILKGE